MLDAIDEVVPLLHAALGLSLLYTKGNAPETVAAWTSALAIAERIGDTEYEKKNFFILDFCAVAEYFEEEYDYDQVIKLPPLKSRRVEGRKGGIGGGGAQRGGIYEHLGEDILSTIQEEAIGVEGMKIDRMFYERFEERVRENDFIAANNHRSPDQIRHFGHQFDGFQPRRRLLFHISRSVQFIARV